MNWIAFFKGLLAAGIGGSAASLSGAVIVPGMTWKQFGMIAAVGAAIAVGNYLKQSPLKP